MQNASAYNQPPTMIIFPSSQNVDVSSSLVNMTFVFFISYRCRHTYYNWMVRIENIVISVSRVSEDRSGSDGMAGFRARSR